MSRFTNQEIRLLRQARQKKQEYMALKMGITKQRYSKLERNDNRPIERTLEILSALGYTEEMAKKFLDKIPHQE